MKRLLPFILGYIFCMTTTTCTTQSYEKVTYTSQIPDGWVTYNVPQAVTFALPTSLELRDENTAFAKAYNNLKNSYEYILACLECNVFTEESEMVFQPKGLNAGDMSKLNSYARVLVNFEKAPDDGMNEEHLRNASEIEMQAYNLMAKETLEEAFGCLTDKLGNQRIGEFVWNDIECKEFNGVICLIMDFERPGVDGTTKVRGYEFYSGNNLIKFTLSYSKASGQQFASIFDKFIYTLSFAPEFVENRIGNNKDIVSADSSMEEFVSSTHNFTYTYNTSDFVSAEINAAQHMILKLKSTEDNLSYITIGADTEADLTGYDLNDPDIKSYLEAADKQLSENAGFKISLVSSCVPTSINGISALRSEFTSTNFGQNQHQIFYRYINKGELQTICFLISEDYVQNHAGIDEELVQNLHIGPQQ